MSKLAHRIDMICDRFEQVWREGPRPKIEDFLPEVSQEEQPALLRELLTSELQLRRQEEEDVDVETYSQRFSMFSEVVNDVFSGSDNEVTHNPTALWLDGVLGGSKVGSTRYADGLLAAVPTEELESHLVERKFAPGDALMLQGEAGTSLMVIGDGVVEVSTRDTSGETHVIDHSDRGDLLGEMSLLTGLPCTANVIAVEHVRVLALPVETFHKLAKQYPELSVILTNIVADRLGKPGRDALADKMLDRYRIKRRLGRGGMGIVYEANDTDSNERVALKMMSHRLVYNAEALQRFRQEADIIESFQHSHIVKLIRRFAAFHTYFIAMAFCEGRTLKQVIADGGPLSNADFQAVLGQLASALLYSHQANVAHRDIKPSNIMMDIDGRVKLMDFGLAEPVLGNQVSSGRACGTPRFMAPEQRLGNVVGLEADYFGLGCVAYEMLTGEHLFDGDEVTELTRDFTSWQPPEFKKLRPDLPDHVCSAIQPSLETDVRQRTLNLQLMAAWAGS